MLEPTLFQLSSCLDPHTRMASPSVHQFGPLWRRRPRLCEGIETSTEAVRVDRGDIGTPSIRVQHELDHSRLVGWADPSTAPWERDKVFPDRPTSRVTSYLDDNLFRIANAFGVERNPALGHGEEGRETLPIAQ